MHVEGRRQAPGVRTNRLDKFRMLVPEAFREDPEVSWKATFKETGVRPPKFAPTQTVVAQEKNNCVVQVTTFV